MVATARTRSRRSTKTPSFPAVFALPSKHRQDGTRIEQQAIGWRIPLHASPLEVSLESSFGYSIAPARARFSRMNRKNCRYAPPLGGLRNRSYQLTRRTIGRDRRDYDQQLGVLLCGQAGREGKAHHPVAH